MKKIFLSVIVFINLFAYEVAPSWYPSINKDVYIAFGDGDDFSSAMTNVLKNINNDVNTTSIITTLDIDILEEDMIENHYFLKIEYNKKSLLDQLTKDIKKLTFKSEDETNQYLLKTELLKNLYKRFAYYPNISMDLNYLYFNDNKYVIKSKDFQTLLSNTSSVDITLDINDELINKENFFLKVLPSYDGYVTLMQIQNAKELNILFSNKKLRTNKATIYPSFKTSDGLEVILEEGAVSSKIMTLAAVCPNKRDFTGHLSLTTFLDKINDCSYTSVISKVN